MVLDDPKSAEGKLPATARQAWLAELLRRSGFLSVAETAERLGVSSMTIRRDLESLEARGIRPAPMAVPSPPRAGAARCSTRSSRNSSSAAGIRQRRRR
jgi:DeoR/GlpR family transcriptional regulator of sugar metabolism